MGRLNVVDLQQTLKTVFGCMSPALFVFPMRRAPGWHHDAVRRARRACEMKLAASRKRRDRWEIDVHKGHLVGFDAVLLGKVA